MSFRPKTIPATVNITRVRNGFVVMAADHARVQGTSIEDAYVFSTLEATLDFLVEKDFEVTDE